MYTLSSFGYLGVKKGTLETPLFGTFAPSGQIQGNIPLLGVTAVWTPRFKKSQV